MAGGYAGIGGIMSRGARRSRKRGFWGAEPLEPRRMLASNVVQLGDQDFQDGGHPQSRRVFENAKGNDPFPFNIYIGNDINGIDGPAFNAGFSFDFDDIPPAQLDEQ